MDRKKIFKTLFSLILFIFVANFLANTFHWYLSIWWFDIPMHFLGGLWLGILFFWLFSHKMALIELDFTFILKVIFAVLIIGIGWEFFEYYFINHIAQTAFNILDTLSDIFFDLSGGLLATAHYLKKLSFTGVNEVQ